MVSLGVLQIILSLAILYIVWDRKPASIGAPIAIIPFVQPRPVKKMLRIVKKVDGRIVRVGERERDHPHIRVAWETPGLGIQRSDGKVFWGKE
jgi:hypothetical protein